LSFGRLLFVAVGTTTVLAGGFSSSAIGSNDLGTVAAEAAIPSTTTKPARKDCSHFVIHLANFARHVANAFGALLAKTATPDASRALNDSKMSHLWIHRAGLKAIDRATAIVHCW
jgi:hypothetical protein